jgi:hypothetical protein
MLFCFDQAYQQKVSHMLAIPSPSHPHSLHISLIALSSFFLFILRSFCCLRVFVKRQINNSSKTTHNSKDSGNNVVGGRGLTHCSHFSCCTTGFPHIGPCLFGVLGPLWALLPLGIEKKLAGFSRYDPKKPERPGPM